MNEIDVGYGWELVTGNLKPTDEFWSMALKGWREGAGKAFGVNYVRRRIDPGEGWEIVSENEVKFCKGFARSNSKWEIYSSGKWTSHEVDNRAISTYRRRKQSPAEPVAPVAEQPSCQWVKTSERLPIDGRVVLTSSMDACYRKDGLWETTESIAEPPTHWLDAPDPPKPEVDEAEEAWKEYFHSLQSNNPEYRPLIKDFMAGYRACQKRSNKGEKK